jgi:hypothetical protein
MKQQRTPGSFKSARLQGGYRARYRNFINQRRSGMKNVIDQIRPEHSSVRDGAGQSNFKRGVINIAIFIALFVGILTLFGFGLAKLNRDAKLQLHEELHPMRKSNATEQKQATPPPAVYPSGHAEIKTDASPDPSSTITLKNKGQAK